MCGIAGFTGAGAALVPALLERLAHRGPDGHGSFTSECGSVTLCHTRLAIIDPSERGAQPMRSADGRVVIVFNGEIYNFRELARDLEKRNVRFRSHSDTEVLLALYDAHGVEMLRYLNGIYALALWDARDGTLFVARDSLGVKPLYICESAGRFAFASEIKALTVLPWVERTLDPQALAHYVQHLWCPTPRTPLASVKKLGPGEALVVSGGRVRRRWAHYALPTPTVGATRSQGDWIEAVRDGLAAAVERQMVSDVPVGAFLSGGLDSSAIVAFARQHNASRLQCFTIDFDAAAARREGFSSDLPYARSVASHLDVDLHVVTVNADMAVDLARMVWQLDEPQADFAGLNVRFIASLARQHGIKVLLSGSGGDDVFSGYRRHRALAADRVWRRIPAPVRRAIGRAGRLLPSQPPALRRVAKLLVAGAHDESRRLASYFDWLEPTLVAELLAPALAGMPLEQPIDDALAAMPASASPLQRMLLLEQRFFLTDHNLNYTDKMSMAEGVETRVPFLDPPLIELASRVPDGLKQRGSEGKWILKQVMQGILPDEVIHRPKTGFGVPLRTWLHGPLEPILHDLLGSESVRRRGLFDVAATTRLLRDFQAGRADTAYGLLSLMCIELWCRQFVDRPVAQLAECA
jgi:asparagine synthase (glutamine-hydrolysing)